MVTTVNELISPVDGFWDVNLVRALFWPVDAERILQIPLHHGREDTVAWHFNRSGLFSVRSAYHVQWEHKYGSRPVFDQAGGSNYMKVWDTLWKLKLPSKVKIFGWRALRGFIPCNGILANKHIGNQSSCPVCHLGCEGVMHVLFTCQRAQAIWRCLGVWDRIREVIVKDHSGSVILEEILRRNVMLSELNNVGFAELILTGGWYLWWERRQVVRGEAVQSFARSAMSIVVLSQNYINATKKEAREKEGWKRPIEDFVKLNIDGSFNEEIGTGTTGAIIRDHTGGVVAMGQRYLSHVGDAPVAEAYALLDGLRLAEQVGCNRIIVNSDCMQVVTTIREGFSATTAAAVYDECLSIWMTFSSISIEHCNRDANQVAHELAKKLFRQ